MNQMNTAVRGQWVVGKEGADVVVRIADFLEDGDIYYEMVLQGQIVGVTPRFPVNKKAHIAEVEELVVNLNASTFMTEEEEERLFYPSPEELKARIANLEAEQREIEDLVRSGMVHPTKAIPDRNDIDREIATLRKELAFLLSEEKLVAVATTSKREAWAEEGGVAIARSRTVSYAKEATNAAFAEVRNGIRDFAVQHMASRPVAQITVHEIIPFAHPDRNNRIGHILFQVPAGLMEVKNWNGQGIEWLPMDQYDYNGFNSVRARLMFGSGYIKLAIREGFNGVPYISWPRERGKDDRWWDVFKTADLRFGIFHSDNNYNVQAALTAFLLTYWGEFQKADVRNRFGFNEHCGNCRHMVYLPIHDGMGYDYENKANPIDTSELTQYGNRMPQWICGIHKVLVDEGAIDDLNEYASFEVRSYTDRETGNLRWLRPDQVLVKGVPVSTYTVRAEGTAERCGECPFYHKNEKKSDRSYNQERDAAEGGYVSKYWTERAQAGRMPVFTKHAGGWSLGFPGEFENPTEFCVQGIGGIEVYGTPVLYETMKKDFVPTTEAYKEDEAQVAKVVNIIHSVCNNFARIEPDTLDALLSMIQSVSSEVKDPMKSRFDRALARLSQTIADHE